ncbi:hypothetical protein BS47DRAFT_1366447 [Hydnum rufescens UP504]|uniref:EamA domain-containing protein n=1 Tax=Hydnum rufescens UP504 TaxID=1448309 RepID=A0A9P6DQU3_9AGAM|nr:hypothetical protein BS47DRAFT_1366447 [Hydnum rufescens UP504]
MPVTEIPEGGLSPAEGRKRLPPLSTRETANLAILFCFLWFVANWSQNASLEHTSVASSTILASMSGFFTLLLGRVFHVEAFSFVRLGTVMTRGRPFSPEGGPSRRPLLGDILALLSAIFYAFYVILLKVRIQDESRVNMRLFFGFVGLFNVLCMWPIGFLLHWTKLEPFRLPSSKMQWVAIAVNMAITFSSDYIYVLAMLKTTPLVVTVGISLTIPCALLGDLFVADVNPRLQVAAGALLVVASFVVLGVEDSMGKAWLRMRSMMIRLEMMAK